jgi:Arc/MetJ-type ribon-helix-helix transcriptional regulator
MFGQLSSNSFSLCTTVAQKLQFAITWFPLRESHAYNAIMSTVRLTPHGEALLQKQLANGSYRSPEEVVERALETLAENSEKSLLGHSKMTPAEAVADIQENRKGVTLGALKIRDLIHEGRKY